MRSIRATRVTEWEKATEEGLDLPAPEVKVLVDRDVLAEHDSRSRARGAGRTSPVATAVRVQAPRPRPELFGANEKASLSDVDGLQL